MAFLYRVGDEIEGSAVEISRFIQLVKRAGGEVRLEGKRAIITFLPASIEESVPVTYVTPEPELEPVVEEVVEEPVVEIQEEYVPKRRGRARKVEPEESEESGE